MDTVKGFMNACASTTHTLASASASSPALAALWIVTMHLFGHCSTNTTTTAPTDALPAVGEAGPVDDGDAAACATAPPDASPAVGVASGATGTRGTADNGDARRAFTTTPRRTTVTNAEGVVSPRRGRADLVISDCRFETVREALEGRECAVVTLSIANGGAAVDTLRIDELVRVVTAGGTSFSLSSLVLQEESVVHADGTWAVAYSELATRAATWIAVRARLVGRVVHGLVYTKNFDARHDALTAALSVD